MTAHLCPELQCRSASGLPRTEHSTPPQHSGPRIGGLSTDRIWRLTQHRIIDTGNKLYVELQQLPHRASPIAISPNHYSWSCTARPRCTKLRTEISPPTAQPVPHRRPHSEIALPTAQHRHQYSEGTKSFGELHQLSHRAAPIAIPPNHYSRSCTDRPRCTDRPIVLAAPNSASKSHLLPLS